MYGATLERTFSNDCPTGLSPLTLPTLAPAWFVQTPRTVTASPVVVDAVLYVGDWSRTFYALDAATGAERWRFVIDPAPGAAFGPIVSTAAVSDVLGVDGVMRRLVIFGGGPVLYALDAADGSLVWRLDLLRGDPGEENETEVESSPAVHGGRVYVGIDTHGRGEESTGGVRGGLLAVDPATGGELWRFEPELDQPGAGCGGMWSSPTLDVARNQVIMATANCSEPEEVFTWNSHTEAVTALDAVTGAVNWTFSPHDPNRLDVDFGATGNLFVDSAGNTVFGIGNKDGMYYALDPATGHERWRTQVAQPGNVTEDFAIGGFIGSTAADDGRVFGGTALQVPIPPVGPPFNFHALDGATGEPLWRGLTQGPTYSAAAAAGGIVLSGALDSTLHGYDAATGLPLLHMPVFGPVSSAPAIVGDWVFIGSGTSSSDACAKEAPGSEACFAFFDTTLGATGGIHALRLAGSTSPPSTPGGTPLRGSATVAPATPGSGDLAAPATGSAGATPPSGSLPATGGEPIAPLLAGVAIGVAIWLRRICTPRFRTGEPRTAEVGEHV